MEFMLFKDVQSFELKKTVTECQIGLGGPAPMTCVKTKASGNMVQCCRYHVSPCQSR